MYVEYRMDEDAYMRLSRWLKNEYEDAKASRIPYLKLLDTWDRIYEQRPKVAIKTFPWIGASNLEPPLAATHVDSIVSREESEYFGTQPWVTVTSQVARWENHAKALQDYMNEVSLVNSGYRDEKALDMLISTKLGTSFQWLVFDSKSKWIRDSRGKKIEVVTHLGPRQCAVHPRDLILPTDARDIQNARWVTIRSVKTWGEIVANVRPYGYNRDAVESIRNRGENRPVDTNRQIRHGVRNTGKVMSWDILTTYCRYQENDYGNQYDIWVDWHADTGTILQAQYNPYDHHQWPISHTRYMFREDAIFGIGIVGMLESLQDELATVHNYCLDNMLAANTIVIVGKENQVDQIEIAPMAWIKANHPKDDIVFQRIGQVLSGSQVGELNTQAMAAQRTGIAEGSVNMQSPTSGLASSRTPATTTAMLVGESNKRFALAIDNNKRADNKLLFQHVMLLKQYWAALRARAQTWNEEKARLIEEMLVTITPEAMEYSLVLSVNASTVRLNRETEKQNLMVVAEFIKGYDELFLQYLTIAAQNPPLQPVIEKILDGASKLVVRILEAYDIKSPEQYIPKFSDVAAGSEEPQSNIDQYSRDIFMASVNNAANGAANGQSGSMAAVG